MTPLPLIQVFQVDFLSVLFIIEHVSVIESFTSVGCNGGCIICRGQNGFDHFQNGRFSVTLFHCSLHYQKWLYVLLLSVMTKYYTMLLSLLKDSYLKKRQHKDTAKIANI